MQRKRNSHFSPLLFVVASSQGRQRAWGTMQAPSPASQEWNAGMRSRGICICGGGGGQVHCSGQIIKPTTRARHSPTNKQLLEHLRDLYAQLVAKALNVKGKAGWIWICIWKDQTKSMQQNMEKSSGKQVSRQGKYFL